MYIILMFCVDHNINDTKIKIITFISSKIMFIYIAEITL